MRNHFSFTELQESLLDSCLSEVFKTSTLSTDHLLKFVKLFEPLESFLNIWKFQIFSNSLKFSEFPQTSGDLTTLLGSCLRTVKKPHKPLEPQELLENTVCSDKLIEFAGKDSLLRRSKTFLDRR